MAAKFDLIHGALLLTIVGLIAQRLRPRGDPIKDQLNERVRELEGELRALKKAPEKIEYRIERYELLWFPLVAASREAREVLTVVCGLPHCKTCVRPLSVSRETADWVCAECRRRYPSSLS